MNHSIQPIGYNTQCCVLDHQILMLHFGTATMSGFSAGVSFAKGNLKLSALQAATSVMSFAAGVFKLYAFVSKSHP